MRPYAVLRLIALLALLLLVLASCGLDESPALPTSVPAAVATPNPPTGAATTTPLSAPTTPNSLASKPTATATQEPAVPPAATATLPPEGIQVGLTAPDFKFTPQGSEVEMKLSDLRGKAVWLNFWYSTCDICVEEMPVIQQAYEAYQDRPVVILGMNTVDPPPRMQRFTEKNGFGWTFAVDRGRVVRRTYGVVGIPTHYFIRPDGVIAEIVIGELGLGDMKRSIDALLEEVPQAH